MIDDLFERAEFIVIFEWVWIESIIRKCLKMINSMQCCFGDVSDYYDIFIWNNPIHLCSGVNVNTREISVVNLGFAAFGVLKFHKNDLSAKHEAILLQ